MNAPDDSGTDPARAAFYAGLPRKRCAAGALITDRQGWILIVEPSYKSVWEIPGGVVEAFETASAACQRECREELGIDVPIGRLLVTEHQTDLGYRGDSIVFVYDGGILGGSDGIRIAEGELESFRFVPAHDLGSLLSSKVARRLMHNLAARADGSCVELDNGVRRS